MDAFRHLSNNRNSVTKFPEHPAPRVYAIFAKGLECLPGILLPPNGLVYIGLSSDLKQRNHFNVKNSGYSSPRRSLGAILKTELNLAAIPRAPGSSTSNYRSFRFPDDGEDRLTQWMWSNLEYSIFRFDGNVKELERSLIRENEPPLNLTQWRNPQKKQIQAHRNICKEEAKIVWQELV